MMGILPKKCPDCGSKNLIMNTNGMMCKNCGLVISDNLFAET